MAITALRKKRLKNAKQQIKRLQARGYVIEDKYLDPASLSTRELANYTNKLYKHSTYQEVDTSIGEVTEYTGVQGRKRERAKSARKAQVTRKVNKIKKELEERYQSEDIDYYTPPEDYDDYTDYQWDDIYEPEPEDTRYFDTTTGEIYEEDEVLDVNGAYIISRIEQAIDSLPSEKEIAKKGIKGFVVKDLTSSKSTLKSIMYDRMAEIGEEEYAEYLYDVEEEIYADLELAVYDSSDEGTDTSFVNVATLLNGGALDASQASSLSDYSDTFSR